MVYAILQCDVVVYVDNPSKVNCYFYSLLLQCLSELDVNNKMSIRFLQTWNWCQYTNKIINYFTDFFNVNHCRLLLRLLLYCVLKLLYVVVINLALHAHAHTVDVTSLGVAWVHDTRNPSPSLSLQHAVRETKNRIFLQRSADCIVPGRGALSNRASMDESTEPEFLAPGVVGRASRPRDPRTKAKYNIFSRLLLWY